MLHTLYDEETGVSFIRIAITGTDDITGHKPLCLFFNFTCEWSVHDTIIPKIYSQWMIGCQHKSRPMRILIHLGKLSGSLLPSAFVIGASITIINANQYERRCIRCQEILHSLSYRFRPYPNSETHNGSLSPLNAYRSLIEGLSAP